MTFQDIQNEVINQLRLDSTNDLSKVKDWINLAYIDTCVTTEYLQQKSTVTPTAGATYTFASTVLRIKQIQITQPSQVVWPPMRPTSLQRILELRAQATNSPVSSPPYLYAMDGAQTMEVYPNFLGTESMDIYAVYSPTVLSANSDVPVLPEPYGSKCLIYGAMVEGAGFSKDLMMGVQGYQQAYGLWVSKLMQHINRRKTGRVQRIELLDDWNTFVPHDPSTDVWWTR